MKFHQTLHLRWIWETTQFQKQQDIKYIKSKVNCWQLCWHSCFYKYLMLPIVDSMIVFMHNIYLLLNVMWFMNQECLIFKQWNEYWWHLCYNISLFQVFQYMMANTWLWFNLQCRIISTKIWFIYALGYK